MQIRIMTINDYEIAYNLWLSCKAYDELSPYSIFYIHFFFLNKYSKKITIKKQTTIIEP